MIRGTIVLMLTSVWIVAVPASRAFPEESFRQQWDRGCDDWQDLLAHSSSVETLKINFERSSGQYHLWGLARMQPELGETTDQLVKSLNEHLDNFSEYKSWIYKGINEHPKKGAQYFVTLNDFFVTSLNESHVRVWGPFDFKVASLKFGSVTTIELKWDKNKKLECRSSDQQVLSSSGPLRMFRMYPRADILEWMIGEITIIRRGERSVDIQTRMVLRPSKLVYTLLPSKIMEAEIKLRAQRVFQNLIEIRRQKVWSFGNVSVPEKTSAK